MTASCYCHCHSCRALAFASLSSAAPAAPSCPHKLALDELETRFEDYVTKPSIELPKRTKEDIAMLLIDFHDLREKYGIEFE